MTNTVVGALSLILAAAFVCRVDLLSWRGHPVLMALHVVGGISSAWVIKEAAAGVGSSIDNMIILGCAAALLAITYRVLPAPGCTK